MYERKVLNK